MKAAIILDSMLKDILEAEKRAREIEREAEKIRADAVAEVELKSKQMIEEKLAEAKAKVEAMREEHRKAVLDSMRETEEDNKKTIEAFLAAEKEKSEEWAETIFRRATAQE